MSFRRTTNASRRRRGFTLVELLVVVGVGSIVLGALGGLYAYTMGQSGDAVAEMLVADQVATAMRDIEEDVRQAVLCEVVTRNGIKALRCKMPNLSLDLNGDGLPDSYRPAALNKQGLERFALGTRVWYYLSDETGVFGAPGALLCRAHTPGDANPTAANFDKAWAFRNSNPLNPRFSLLGAANFSVVATTHMATVDLTASCADYGEHRPSASDSNARQRTVRLVQQIFWENGRT